MHVAFKSVRISISVSLLVRAQGDPEEWPLWTRRTGVIVDRIPCPDTKLLVASVGGLGRENSNLSHLLNSKLAYAFT